MKKFIISSLAAATLLSACCNCPEVSMIWGDSYTQYALEYAVESDASPLALSGWKGETVGAQALVRVDSAGLEGVSLKLTAFKGADGASFEGCPRFVSRVWGDALNEDFGQCGARNKADYDSVLVADAIIEDKTVDLAAGECQCIWVRTDIPSDAAAGEYSAQLKLMKGCCCLGTLDLVLTVVDRVLKPASEWEFHLDLWQNPYAVARYAGAELWSEEHFKALEPVMKNLARAGQKVVTATILDRPWNGQTEDPFGSMVSKTLKADGSWAYGYEAFDKWVEFMAGIGIDSQINCYSLLPWHMEFDYFDEAAGEQKILKCNYSDKEYADYWIPFLSEFASHLKEKGWFDKTMVAMDERPREAMLEAFRVIKSADPDFKISLAGVYHEDLADMLDDYCVTSIEIFPAEIVQGRRELGQCSTWYTCCAEKYPNTFMVSPLAEASWIGWYTVAAGFDGYLRWAFNSWTAEPFKDARFRTWPAGDCYMIYPGDCSSLHFEKLIEGIQDYQKCLVILADNSPENEALRSELSELLTHFTIAELGAEGAEGIVRKAHALLN